MPCWSSTLMPRHVDKHGGPTASGYTVEELRGTRCGRLLVDETIGLRTVVRRRMQTVRCCAARNLWTSSQAGNPIPVSRNRLAGMCTRWCRTRHVLRGPADVGEIRVAPCAKESEISARRLQGGDELRAPRHRARSRIDEDPQVPLARRAPRDPGHALPAVSGHETCANLAQRQGRRGRRALAGARLKTMTHRADPHAPADLERVAPRATPARQRPDELARPGPDTSVTIDLTGSS